MTPWTIACQAPLSSRISQSLLKFMSTELVAAQSSHSLSLLSPALKLSQHQGLFQWVSTLQQVAKDLVFQLQYQFFQWILRADFLYDRLVGSSCSPRDSQGSCPAPKFRSINSLALRLPYGPTFTSVCEDWKNHSFDYTDFCQQSDVSAFEYSLGLS